MCISWILRHKTHKYVFYVHHFFKVVFFAILENLLDYSEKYLMQNNHCNSVVLKNEKYLVKFDTLFLLRQYLYRRVPKIY